MNLLSRLPRFRASGLPVAVWAAIVSATTSVVVVATAAAVLGLSGRLDYTAHLALGLATVVGLVGATLAAFSGARLGAALQQLRSEALRRMSDPDAAVSDHAPIRGGGLELSELARTLEALHLRIRVADQVADRHRRSAETASAGVVELLSGLVAAEEGARGQLAAELHDTVAQSLMMARSLLVSGRIDPSTLTRAGEYVEDAEEQVRAVMARTRPPALRDGDLASAIRGLRDDMRMRYGLEIHVDWPEAAHALPLVSAVTVYRFFQEALINVVKHADVDEAWVSLAVDERGLMASVRDEGPGFDPTAVKPEKGRHVGLGLLSERARLAGGSLTVDAMPTIGGTGGTLLTLRLPRSGQVGTADSPGLLLPNLTRSA